MDRRFALPTVSALGLTLGGCGAGDTIVGDWALSSYTYNGETYPLPYTADGVTYDGTFQVTEALAATFDLTYSDGVETGSTILTGTATETDEKAIFDVSLAFGDETFTATCDTTDDLLSCTGTVLSFEGARAEE
jgi:hypothetical protein